MNKLIQLFAIVGASIWLYDLVYHTIMMDATIWELIYCLGMFGLSIWLYEIKSNDEEDIEEEN
jgi:hypothetical protein